jgi:circadian clock protein KaiB
MNQRSSGTAMTTLAKARRAKKPDADPEYLLRLFVSGFTSRSRRAIDNLKNLCERHLAGRYRIEVVDLHQSPGLARDEQIIATPTLLKVLPFPPRRVIGDLSQADKVLRALDIQ